MLRHHFLRLPPQREVDGAIPFSLTDSFSLDAWIGPVPVRTAVMNAQRRCPIAAKASERGVCRLILQSRCDYILSSDNHFDRKAYFETSTLLAFAQRPPNGRSQ
jgi:hypothetical protein